MRNWWTSSKRKPRVTLIKREGGKPKWATLTWEERTAIYWAKPLIYLMWAQLVFMPVAYFLVLFWPPYHNVFAVTNWIADILPHSIFGILTVTQAELDAVGATLPRDAYIHFVVEQIIVAMIYIFWPLIMCRTAWRLYPITEEYLQRTFVNLDEFRASRTWRTKLMVLIALPCLVALIIWVIASPDFLLMLIEKGQKPGLIAVNATGTAWAGMNILFLFGGIVQCARGSVGLFTGEWKQPKN